MFNIKLLNIHEDYVHTTLKISNYSVICVLRICLFSYSIPFLSLPLVLLFQILAPFSYYMSPLSFVTLSFHLFSISSSLTQPLPLFLLRTLLVPHVSCQHKKCRLLCLPCDRCGLHLCHGHVTCFCCNLIHRTLSNLCHD